MTSRVEFERSVTLAGEPVQLYVTCGSQDDYLELVLPDRPELEAPARQRLARLQQSTPDDLLDLRFSEDRPTTVSVLALYAGLGASEWRSRPYPERLASILTRLAEAEPGFDFGDLLPERPPAHQVPPFDQAQSPTAAAEPVPVAPAAGPTAILSTPRVAPVPAASRPVAPHPTVNYLGRAGELAARGRVHKALRAVEDALRQNAADPDAWELRQDLVLLERRERRRQREPRNAQAQLEVAFSYLTLGCDEEAIQGFGEACRLKPDLYLAHLLLGIAHHHQKQLPEARRAYERAARLRPEEQFPRELLSNLARGVPPPRPAEDTQAARARSFGSALATRLASVG